MREKLFDYVAIFVCAVLGTGLAIIIGVELIKTPQILVSFALAFLMLWAVFRVGQIRARKKYP